MDPSPLSPSALRHLLVRAAHAVLASARGHHPDLVPCPDPELLAPRGVFVTLRRGEEPAGCIGFVSSPLPLWECVARAARAAACEDSRFEPITVDDLVGLSVEVSVLTVPVPIAVDAFALGRHGLVLRAHGRQAVLLPQVAHEHRLDRAGFLAALCHKVSLRPEVAREATTELLGFEVQDTHANWAELDPPALPLSGGK